MGVHVSYNFTNTESYANEHIFYESYDSNSYLFGPGSNLLMDIANQGLTLKEHLIDYGSLSHIKVMQVQVYYFDLIGYDGEYNPWINWNLFDLFSYQSSNSQIIGHKWFNSDGEIEE